MPLQKLQFRPGLNREGTDYANEGGWYDGDKIRFRSGFPEKIGGWSRLSNDQYVGIARSMWNWINLEGSNYLGVGTNEKYYIELGGFFNDITPIVHTSTTLGAAAGPFTATANSSIITVVDTGYAPNVGDWVTFSGTTSLGGNVTATVLDAEFKVVSTVNATAYTISVAPVVATAGDSGNGGATVTAAYQYPIGLDVAVTGTGWGSGPWSRGGWGEAYSGGVSYQLRLWSNDNYGQDLLIAPRGGPLFYWVAADGTSVRAKYLSDLADFYSFDGDYVPTSTYQVLSSAIQRFVIAMGANSYLTGDPNTDFNPMLVRWSDQENPYEWVPAVTNQAGEFALSNGSYIMTSEATRQEILIWTDSC